MALAGYARRLLADGAETGHLLESGLRRLFDMFAVGLSSAELNVSALDGVLFGRSSTKLIDSLQWGERSVAVLLDRLLWTEGKKSERLRVHYGPLDVEDLGRVYEALLELEPGFSEEPMVRLRRDKLEVVVPAMRARVSESVEQVEEIPARRFYLRVGLGRKATGSYYTPHAFVRFLVQETLGPLVDGRSPKGDPKPMAILDLRVIDPAMGSGHFLVEACRYLGDKLYESTRLCDDLAVAHDEGVVASGRNQIVASESICLVFLLGAAGPYLVAGLLLDLDKGLIMWVKENVAGFVEEREPEPVIAPAAMRERDDCSRR